MCSFAKRSHSKPYYVASNDRVYTHSSNLVKMPRMVRVLILSLVDE